MKIDEIRKTWISKNRDVQNEVQLWDSQSADPTYYHVYDKFLELLESQQMLDKSYDVLDIGCGVGIYSISLADRVNTSSGLDISSKMIDQGRKILETSGINNVSLNTADWSAIDLEKQGMKERYDLVFAHNTPAICDANTFEKMIEASRRFCAICSPLKMKQPVMEKIHEIVKIPDDSSESENNFVLMLDMLFQKGYQPKLHYEEQVWPMNQSFEDSCAFYLGRVAMTKKLTENETADIKDYLISIAVDNLISDQIDTTVVTLYWEK